MLNPRARVKKSTSSSTGRCRWLLSSAFSRSRSILAQSLRSSAVERANELYASLTLTFESTRPMQRATRWRVERDKMRPCTRVHDGCSGISIPDRTQAEAHRKEVGGGLWESSAFARCHSRTPTCARRPSGFPLAHYSLQLHCVLYTNLYQWAVSSGRQATERRYTLSTIKGCGADFNIFPSRMGPPQKYNTDCSTIPQSSHAKGDAATSFSLGLAAHKTAQRLRLSSSSLVHKYTRVTF